MSDPVVALALDDALAHRFILASRTAQPPPGQRFASEADYPDDDWTGPPAEVAFPEPTVA